jgi:NRPS condensation-like uncharacterized protein
MTTTAQLNILDELYMHLDREEEPFNVHLEVECDHSIDDDELIAAVRRAAARHPIARARLGDWSGTDRRYCWQIADELPDVPLASVDCADPDELERARQGLLGHGPPLERQGPFELVHARGPDGDSLILNLHHAAGDGMGALRLMASILRELAGDDDPVADVDPLEARDPADLVGAKSVGDRLTRVKALVEHMTRFASPPMRIAPRGGTGEPGYGFELLAFDGGAMEAIKARKQDGATVNDVLLGALGVTARRWNEQHDAGTGRAALMMPVNLRPPDWRNDVIANFASYVSVHLAEEELETLPRAIAAASERTDQIKDDQIAGLIVDLLAFPSVLPTAIKQRLEQLIPLTGNVVVDTAVLSNLGKLDALPGVKRVWFSPPGRMPLGASLGVATAGDDMFVTLRYRHALWDAAAAAEFGALYREVLVG